MNLIDDKIKNKIQNCNIFVTGGTGFFGKSLLKYFIELCSENCAFNVFILSRNPEIFLKNNREFLHHNFKFVTGDIREFSIPKDIKFDYFIHGATAADLDMIKNNPDEIFSVIVDGTKYVLEQCKKVGVRKLLFISSGAVYGGQPFEIAKISESFRCHPKTIYGKGKLIAENLCLESEINTAVARCFTFIGEYLPLDLHFAAGNFINNALNGESIVINGDGSAVRSYMHSEDLVRWLIMILLFSENGDIFNVGSDESVTIKDLAYYVRECFGNKIEVEIKRKRQINLQANRYVPDVNLAKKKLKLALKFDNKSAVEKTIKCLKAVKK